MDSIYCQASLEHKILLESILLKILLESIHSKSENLAFKHSTLSSQSSCSTWNSAKRADVRMENDCILYHYVYGREYIFFY